MSEDRTDDVQDDGGAHMQAGPCEVAGATAPCGEMFSFRVVAEPVVTMVCGAVLLLHSEEDARLGGALLPLMCVQLWRVGPLVLSPVSNDVCFDGPSPNCACGNAVAFDCQAGGGLHFGVRGLANELPTPPLSIDTWRAKVTRSGWCGDA